MGDTTRYERIGSALHALAADLAAERRRASALRRENEKLSAQLEALKEELATSVTKGRRLIALVDLPPSGGRERDVTSRRTISRYGVKLRRADFPRDYLLASRRP